MRTLSLAAALSLTALTAACSESRYLPDASTADSSSPDTGAPVDASLTDAGVRADARREDTVTPTDTRPPSTPRVVVNEVSAQGDDWIELFNAGSTAADLSMHYVADSNDDGTPRVDRALRFPAGATLAPGAYLFVRADVSNAEMGPQTDCAPGPSPCFHVAWGISASNGETVFLLASDQTELDRFEYAADAAPAERSMARLPNGTGEPAVASPTPGAANRGP